MLVHIRFFIHTLHAVRRPENVILSYYNKLWGHRMSLAFTMLWIFLEESEEEDYIWWFIKVNVQSRPLTRFYSSNEKVAAIAFLFYPTAGCNFLGIFYVVLAVAVQLICIQDGIWSAWCYKMESRFFILVPVPLGQHKAPLKLVYWSPFPDWILNSQMLMALLWTLCLFKCQTQLSRTLSRWAWPKESSKMFTLSRKIWFLQRGTAGNGCDRLFGYVCYLNFSSRQCIKWLLSMKKNISHAFSVSFTV